MEIPDDDILDHMDTDAMEAMVDEVMCHALHTSWVMDPIGCLVAGIVSKVQRHPR